jgi:hypothetical protein
MEQSEVEEVSKGTMFNFLRHIPDGCDAARVDMSLGRKDTPIKARKILAAHQGTSILNSAHCNLSFKPIIQPV